MSDRFFSSQPIVGDRAVLDGQEAHHLMHVMRAAVGDRVTLFDGSGAEFESVVDRLGRSAVELRVLTRREVDRELPFTLVVGVALPKGDRQKWLVEKLTELGVTELVPLITERGVAQPTSGAVERLQRTVIEASKQCGRNRLMRISETQTWPELANQHAPPQAQRLLCHLGKEVPSSSLAAAGDPVFLAIGPEGGFTEEEVGSAMKRGWRLAGLGPRTLRVETAAVAIVAAVTLSCPPRA